MTTKTRPELKLRPMSICDAQDHYVIVVERDLPTDRKDGYSPAGPLVWEHYLGPSTEMDAIREHAKSLKKYGKVRIARLQFLPEE